MQEELKKAIAFLDCLISKTKKLLYDDETGKDRQPHCRYRVLWPRYYCAYETWKFLSFHDAL